MVKLVDAVDSKSTGATLCRFESDHRHNLKLTTNLGLEASFGKSFRVLVKNEEMIPRNRTFRGQNETPWSQDEQDVRLRNGKSAKIHPFPLLIIFQNLIALTKQQAQYF